MLVADNPQEKWIESQGFYLRDTSGVKERGPGLSYYQKSLALVEKSSECVIRSFSGEYHQALEKLYFFLKDRLLRRQLHKFHAKRRCKQRFGCKLSTRQYEGLCNQIRSQTNAYFLRKKDVPFKNKRTIWAVKFKDMWLPVVYDKKLKSIVTVLPQRRLEMYLGVKV